MQIIDRFSQFNQIMGETKDAPLEEKLEKFKAQIIAPNAQCYAHVIGISDENLRQYIQQWKPGPHTIPGENDILDRFHQILGLFKDRFPGFMTDFEVYLLPSLNLFKGIAVPTRETTFLLLGMDALSELSERHSQGYIAHELFHVYHYQQSCNVRKGAELALRTGKMPALWALLWTEGIASHAVRILYPEMDEADVLDWRPLVEQVKPLLPQLAREARKGLRSDLPQDIAGFFYFPRGGDNTFPVGCGYYIGMLVANLMARDRSIDALIHNKEEVLINEIELALVELQG